MNSCLYEGWVRHRRRAPVEHTFRYRLFAVCLDLSELDRAFAGRWLWSTRGPNLAWYRRADFFGPADVPLDVAVRDEVERQSGRRPDGSVRLLGHLRYGGFVFNPVVFYYCYDAAGALQAILADVSNTPWGEHHPYVLTRDSGPIGRYGRFVFAKDFHVSPFMPMELSYDWRFSAPGEHLSVHMALTRDGATRPHFDATLSMRRRPATGRQLARALVRYPLMTAQVYAGIYWQALRLYLKRAPYHSHPRRIAELARQAGHDAGPHPIEATR